MKYKIRKEDEYALTVGDLRQLLSWAAQGVHSTLNSGDYNKTIIATIRRHAKDIQFTVENKSQPLEFRPQIINE